MSRAREERSVARSASLEAEQIQNTFVLPRIEEIPSKYRGNESAEMISNVCAHVMGIFGCIVRCQRISLSGSGSVSLPICHFQLSPCGRFLQITVS